MGQRFAIGVVVVAVATVLFGCAAPDRVARTVGPPKPSAMLASAAAKLDGQSLRFTIDADGDLVSGRYDATAKAFALTGGTGEDELQLVVTGDDLYIKDPDADEWRHFTLSRFRDGATVHLVANPLVGRDILVAAGAVNPDAKQDQPGIFTGVVDLTKVTATGSVRKFVDAVVAAAGSTATAIPFTATVDRSGRLSGVRMTFPRADDGDDLVYDLRIVEFDAAVSVAPPPREQVTEAPPSAYEND